MAGTKKAVKKAVKKSVKKVAKQVGGLTDEGRAKIAEAQHRRWARYHKEAKALAKAKQAKQAARGKAKR